MFLLLRVVKVHSTTCKANTRELRVSRALSTRYLSNKKVVVSQQYCMLKAEAGKRLNNNFFRHEFCIFLNFFLLNRKPRLIKCS